MRLFLFAHPITDNKTNNVSNQTKKRRMGCGKEITNRTNERAKKHGIQFLTEANLTPRSVARFSRVGRHRFPGAPISHDAAPRLRSGLRAASALAGRPAREYARQVQCRSHGNAKAC